MKTPVLPFYLVARPNFPNKDKLCDIRLNTNPLKPFGTQIRGGKFLGFPLKLSGSDLEQFGSKKCLKYLPIGLYCLIFISFQIATSLILLLSGANLDFIYGWFKDQGYSTVDFLCMMGMFVPHTFALVKQNANLLGPLQEWNELNRYFGKILSQADVSSCYKQLGKGRALVLMLFVLMNILSMVMNFEVLKNVLPLAWLIPMVVGNAITTLLSYYPLTLFLIFAILNHYLLLFKKVLNHYNQRIHIFLTMTSGPSNLTEFLHDGIELVEALALFDVIFGSVVALEVALCLIIELFGSYFGSTLSQAMQSQRLHVLYFALIFAVFGAQGFVRYYILTRNGQAMTNAMKDCHASLTKLDIWSSPLSPVQEKQMGCILARFSQPTAWSPMGLFDLSQASYVLIHSVIVTYVVVLIQFKDVGTDEIRSTSGLVEAINQTIVPNPGI